MSVELKPQPGPQEAALRSSADVVFYGGGAGSGKSFGLLLEQLYDVDNPGFRAVIFRRTVPMLRQPGGLVDTSESVFPLLGARLNQSTLEWQFPKGATVKFAGMELEQDRFAWQGAQIALVCFDEVQEFEESQFWFLLSRNRSMSGAKCRVRCTCNPISDGWLRSLLDWWIGADGYPIQERSGKLRWFVRDGDVIVWADTKAELIERFGADSAPKSMTFIPALVRDNAILLARDPGYVSNLRALPMVERERLLFGNWNIRWQAGNYFRREWFGQPLDTVPTDIVARCRFWDRAASEQRAGSDPDATVGLLLSKTRQGLYVIEDCVKLYASPHQVEMEMAKCAKRDGPQTIIGFMCDPGSAGKYESAAASRALDGCVIKIIPASGAGNKETRARPVSSQCEAGNVKLVRGTWNSGFLAVLENFPAGKHDDEVDGLSGAHQILSEQTGGWDETAVRQVLAANNLQLNQAHNLDREAAKQPFRITPGGQFPGVPNLSRMGQWTPTPRRLK
jgi:predicted phage terminase large subunit-like protein